MTYRGNSALPPDTQQRILGTFEQTLALAEDGSRQEALLGCDFILRMDPRFEPARLLQERLQGASGAVHVNDLRTGLARPAPAATVPVSEPPAELFAGFDLELPDLPPLGRPSIADVAALRLELTALFDRRAFREVVETAERERAALVRDPDLAALVETAQARLEAEPYVARFLAAARAAQQAGNRDEAERLLAKARSLDPTHPDLAAAPPPPAPPAPETPPRGVPLATDALFAGGDELFGGPPAGAESESDRRIAELLGDGQRAFDRGDPQGAIDAWSRIFLIDIDHEEAARRIDQARKLKAEGERQVEEVFHDGLSRLEAGDTAAARRAFEQVLEMQPGHLTAREYLQQIEAGKTPLPPRPAPAAAAGMPLELSLPPGGERGGAEELKEEILVPPEPGEARAAEKRERPAVAAARPGGLRKFALVGGAVLALVAAGGWFVFQNRERLFPNSQEEPSTAPAAEKDPIARAAELHQSGRTSMAIAQLRRLPPGNPHYEQAQALIKQWEAPSPAPATAPRVLAPEQATRRETLLAAAREAAARREYLGAVESLDRAAALQPLAGADAELLRQAKAGLEPLTSQVDMFRQQDWEYLVPKLWVLRESDPANPVVTRLLVDSYHNLGVQALQQGDVKRAETHLTEALNLAPDDAETRRHYLFAQTYQQRSQDLLYRIYVKYLPFR